MKNPYKVSYQKHWSEDGTVYTQRVKISREDYLTFCEEMDLEFINKFPFKKHYCHTDSDTIYMRSKDTNAKVVYLKSTETRFFCFMMMINLKDRNTYLVIA